MELSNTPMVNLDLVIEDRQRLTAMRKEIDVQIDRTTAIIKNEMAVFGVDRLDTDTRTITLSVRQGRSSIDKGTLIALGVSTDIVEQATKAGKDYTQLDVRARKVAA